MRGNRDICYRYYTRFSHRARDDVLPGAVDSTQAATSLPDSIVGRRMACQSDIHVATLGGWRGDCGAGYVWFQSYIRRSSVSFPGTRATKEAGQILHPASLVRKRTRFSESSTNHGPSNRLITIYD